ncbi:hypothetical protein ABZP36_024165 [Zizania latifolia]
MPQRMAVGGGGSKDGVVAMARRMWRVLRAVLYMLRRGLPSGRKLAMDLHLLLHRGKIAGKALGDLITFHPHGHGGHGGGAFSAAGSSLSCRAVDPALAVYEPSSGRREVEFSCSNTPSSTGGGGGGGLLGAARRRRRNRNYRRDDEVTAAGYDAAYIARVFEMLNDSEHLFNDDDDHVPAVAPTTTTSSTPPPALCTPSYARSPAARRPRITDSPFAAADEGQQVDRQADEFIKRFYEQLRAQRSVAATPDYYGASPYSGHGSRPLAAGIA